MEQIEERLTKENVYICVTLSIKLCRPTENNLVDASLYLAVDVHQKPDCQSLLNVYRHGVSIPKYLKCTPYSYISVFRQAKILKQIHPPASQSHQHTSKCSQGTGYMCRLLCRVGINQDSIITPPNIQSDSVSCLVSPL